MTNTAKEKAQKTKGVQGCLSWGQKSLELLFMHGLQDLEAWNLQALGGAEIVVEVE